MQHPNSTLHLQDRKKDLIKSGGEWISPAALEGQISQIAGVEECGVALVRMDDPEMGPGTEVEVTGTDGATYSAQLCSLPMYDAEGAIVRGRNTMIPEGPEPWRG